MLTLSHYWTFVMAYWLFKTEPYAFSIDDLQQAPQQQTFWEGIRNYQAEIFTR